MASRCFFSAITRLSAALYTVFGVVLFQSLSPSVTFATEPTPVALTLSGGVSLGAYQAGSLHYATQLLRQNPTILQTKLLTGASAGALNALFAVFELCGTEASRTSPSDVSTSEFYRAWTEFEARDFLAPKNNGQSLFSRQALSQVNRRLEDAWKKGLPESCDIVLGISVTRLQPLTETSRIGFSRQGEKLNLRIRGRGPGRTPLITNYVNPGLFPRALLLDLHVNDDAQNFAALSELLFASSAFPLAFQPQTLRTCVASDSERWQNIELPFRCPAEDVRTDHFLDGGLVDNKPLALAEKVASSGLFIAPTGKIQWRDIPAVKEDPTSLPRSSLLYFYSDLGTHTNFQTNSSNSPSPLVNLTDGLLGLFFQGSRNQDSTALLEQSPSLENQIASPKNLVPRLGDPMLGFFGFLERDFRIFDFHLGLWETRKYAREKLRTSLRIGEQLIGTKLVLPEIVGPSVELRLSCLDEILDGVKNNACEKMADDGFVKLARVAAKRREARNTDFQFLANALADEQYEYRDLGLSAHESWRAPARIKTEAIAAISALAAEQPLSERWALGIGGPASLNLIEPLPVERDVTFAFGPQTSLRYSALNSAGPRGRTRLVFGFGLEDLDRWLGPSSGAPVATPFVGFEVEPGSWQAQFLQARLSLTVGYKFGRAHGNESCETDNSGSQEHLTNCLGIVIRPGVSLTIIERLRLQTELEVMPFQSGSQVPWRLQPSLGLQFYF